MIPFFSTTKLRREQVAGRALVTIVALLFLLTALFHALPSRDELFAFLERSSMAGYESVTQTTPVRPSVLEEFYDTPLSEPQVSSSEESCGPTKPVPAPTEKISL